MVIISKKYLKFIGLVLLLTTLFSCGKGSGTPNMATAGTSNTNTNSPDPAGGGSHDKPVTPTPSYEPPVGKFFYINPTTKNSTFIFDSSTMSTITPITAGWDVKPNNFYEDPQELITDPKTNQKVPKLTYYGLNLDSSGSIQGTPTTSFDEQFTIFAKNDYNTTEPIPNAPIHIIYSNSRGLTFNLVNPILDNSKNTAVNTSATYTITNPNPEIPIKITSISTDKTIDPYTGTDPNFNPDYSTKTGCTNHILNATTPSCSFSVSYLDKTSTIKHNYAFILTTLDSYFGTKTYNVGTDIYSVPQITAQNTIATQCPSVAELANLNPLNWSSAMGSYSSDLTFSGAGWGGPFLLSANDPGVVYCNYGSILGYIIKSTHHYVSPTTNWNFGTITFPPPPVCHEGMYGIKICVPGTGPGTTQTITTFSSCTSSDPNACQFQPTPS